MITSKDDNDEILYQNQHTRDKSTPAPRKLKVINYFMQEGTEIPTVDITVNYYVHLEEIERILGRDTVEVLLEQVFGKNV